MRYHYSREEILADHPYERPLVLDGVPCHGGFVDGRYVSPRTRWRAPAIAAWQARLPAGGAGGGARAGARPGPPPLPRPGGAPPPLPARAPPAAPPPPPLFPAPPGGGGG